MKLVFKKKRGWLWLCLVCFGLLLSLIYIEISVFYPQVKRYFDNTGSLTAQPLSARARTYLIKSLELFSQAEGTEENLATVRYNLELAYGLLNIEVYRQQYPCTVPAMEQIDLLEEQLRQHPSIGMEVFSLGMLPILKCTDLIQAGQDEKRSALAIGITENLNFHRKLLFWGTILMVVTGAGFWILHFKQRRMIADGRAEADRWIRHAMRDGLTDVLNRRAFDTDLVRCMARYKEGGNLFSLLMCDIDYFKQYNDILGHVEGDKALQYIAGALAGVLRDRDSLYRYGGEELVILLDNTNMSQARQVGLRALASVRQMNLPHPGSEFGYLTISIGCATVSETDESSESLLALADRRLYKAKLGGRNRLVTTSASV